jgi:two-component system sensor histidine kinase CpxA
MRRLSSLYFKIFGWFWLTAVAGVALVLSIALFTGTQPLGYRWMRLTQDMYAHTAVDFYTTGGKASLAQYLRVLDESSSMDARLLDANGQDLLGGTIPVGTESVLEESSKTGHSSLNLGRSWCAATPVDYNNQRYTFVVAVHPMSKFVNGSFAGPLILRMILALVVAAFFCFLLARSITAPIRALQAASLKLESGDFSSRVLPTIKPRNDEIADTARAFDRMADRIEVLVQKRQELLANISHELRSPLTRLSVSLELIRRGENDVVEQMQRDLDRLNDMIGQILLLTRLDMKEAEPARERWNLKPVLEAIADDAQYERQDEEKTILLSAPSDCFVVGDVNLLRSCFENIVRNAVNYTAAGTSVAVTVSAEHHDTKDFWRVEVEDQGPGVPSESLPFLFDPFYRVSQSRDRTDGGAGLGLAIAQRVVHVHGGRISADNATTHSGLNVQVTLPAF